MRARTAVFLLVALLVLHVILLIKVGDERSKLPSVAGGGFIIPAPILRITSLEFKGLVSDFLFFSALIFEGSTHDRIERPRIKPEEWQWMKEALTASTDLDPCFSDPYWIANAYMTWDGGMIRETNALLEKGTKYRDWDWMLPFFAGFNSFFFLHDNEKAVELLKTASERPGPSRQLLSLASRLSFKEKNLENAVLFLEALVNKTEDKEVKKKYEMRLQALRARLVLENAVIAYKKQFRNLPRHFEQLLAVGILQKIPDDPYGGEFSITPEGKIIGTTDQELLPYQH